MPKTSSQICLACGGPLDAPVQGGKIRCTYCGTVNLIEAHETKKGDEIICPECGAANPQKAQHCGRCGIKLEFNCPNCNALNSYGTIYCVQCGVDIQAEIKRRQAQIIHQQAEETRRQEEIRQQVAKDKRKKQISRLVTTVLVFIIVLCLAVLGGDWLYTNEFSPAALSTKTVISFQETVTEKYFILFQDNFSDPNSGWDNSTITNGSSRYDNGGYRITVNTTKWIIWDTLPDVFQNDIRIEVDATKLGGPDANGFGVLCRYQDDMNFYLFTIASNGYAEIGKMLKGNFQVISSVDNTWTKSAAINTGSDTNHIRADCSGSSLTLYVNGSQAATATDSSFSGGMVGLSSASYDTAGTDILFDNFFVYRP